VEPIFAADYAATFVEVRDCRQSIDHDVRPIRIVADPAALVPYRDRAVVFPEGAVVLKEEYAMADPDCAAEPIEWTVMRRLASATTEDLGWEWQRVDAERNVTENEARACAGCHEDCVPPDGYEGTCAVPP
jgi:hypothetical protein